ncbi:unnamed protein product, partial [Ectocarpus sp. 12 AP-2014]
SRQALYLHFPNRADLLVATTRYLDEIHQINAVVDEKMTRFQGLKRLNGFIDAWGNYIPKIYGVGKALMSIKDTDAEARAAWEDRMLAVRALCVSTVDSLSEEGALSTDLERDEAVDMLWTLVSVANWEQLTKDCGWSQSEYITHMQRSASKLILA